MERKRDWMSTGAELVKRLGREEVEQEIDRLDWQDVPEGGSLTLGAMPGYGINAAIRELEIPKVTKVAVGSFDRPAASPEEDGFYPGFYGIEGNYKNGRVRVYILDTGTILQPLVADHWPVGLTDAARQQDWADGMTDEQREDGIEQRRVEREMSREAAGSAS